MGKSMHAWQDFHTAKPRNEPIGKVEIVPDLLPSPEESRCAKKASRSA
jgi:hypothetical protein